MAARRTLRDQSSGSRGVQVIARAASILRVLEERPDGLSLAEIARKADLARSTVQRILTALAAEDFVIEAQPGRGMRIGPGLARIAASLSSNLTELLHAKLVALRDQCGETVDLSILSGGSAVFIDQIPGRQRLVALSAVGQRFPLHCTANGKAFLAAMSPHDLARATAGTLPRLTERTITDHEALAIELERVRAEGIAYDREEHSEGICAVGTVIRGLTGLSVAVSVPMPAQRFYGREQMLHDSLLRWAERVERELGGAEAPPAAPVRRRARAS